MSGSPTLRAARLKRYLDGVLRGSTPLDTDSKFLEAICLHPDPVQMLTRLIGSEGALSNLANATRFDTSHDFLNGRGADFLDYLRPPELATISSGTFLRRVLIAIASPPIFFDALKNAFLHGGLSEKAQICFGWFLLHLIAYEEGENFRDVAKDPVLLSRFTASSSVNVRTHGRKIKHYMDTCTTPSATEGPGGPGGRHDNDQIDFRQIVIRPTADEVASQDQPFLRPAHFIKALPKDNEGLLTWIDNQFRLLRDDMLFDMKEELQMLTNPKKKKAFQRGFTFDGLSFHSVHIPDTKESRWGIALQASKDIPQFKGASKAIDRKKLLSENRKILRHGSLACLTIKGEIVAFPTITRDENLLVQNPPVVVIALEGIQATTNALSKIKTAPEEDVRLIQVDTAIFSYEPVLRALQSQHTLELAGKLMGWSADGSNNSPPWPDLARLAENLRRTPNQDVVPTLKLKHPTPIILDPSQLAALCSGLTQSLSLIQGPPGTGKSFVGSLITKAIHDSTDAHILVVCYTNHALDQFLQDLITIGIPTNNIVRLGGKGNVAMDQLSLFKQKKTFKLGRADWTIIDSHKLNAATYKASLTNSFQRYQNLNVANSDLLAYLEFEEPTFYEAFRVEPSADGMTRIGKNRRKIDDVYLLTNWLSGWDPRPCDNQENVLAAKDIWQIPRTEKTDLVGRWKEAIFKEEIVQLAELASEYNKSQAGIDKQFAQGDASVLRDKRIIACTTTGAAKYIELIQSSANPDVVVVEEAGEILESHVISALTPTTKQLILIGDHKQLRPKVQHYKLTVEKGDGYDLNRSLFERLVLDDYPHETLQKQHRMRPEISSLVRELTYPELRDAPSTLDRDHIRGVRSDIVFISHTHPEGFLQDATDRRDLNSTSSKFNVYEVEMVLNIVRYLGQQGYGTEELVILTPYLGQLSKLVGALRKSNDPVLNDLDSHDLVRAGLIPDATARLSRKPIRIATIDNYQGEESDIVIISLTRSNDRHDIGFMSSPERLNVLLSRARMGLIMLGNVDTFSKSRTGGDLWSQLFALLKSRTVVFDGFPVQCERHPVRKAMLTSPEDFDTHCPEGGCQEPCGALLSCGIHSCISPCHQLSDHSKLPCPIIIKDRCSAGHPLSWKCSNQRPSICHKCERERKRQEAEQERLFKRDEEREKARITHDQTMTELAEKIQEVQDQIIEKQLAKDREEARRQRQKDLQEMKANAEKRTSSVPAKPSPPPVSPSISSLAYSALDKVISPFATSTATPKVDLGIDPPPDDAQLSPSEKRWKDQKDLDGARNATLDDIMAMTGLEIVKDQIMNIKGKIDTAQRQGISLKDERMHVAMLGNPGTGKTTIARLYAKFLTTVDILPGAQFIETTGSRLANDGVDKTKTQLENVVKSGGGAIFIDEAYQLTGSSSFQGREVLDFILAEIENNVGMMVFIFAGYKKEMESFFEHNPGIPSRVPYRLQFEDYTDDQLLTMLRKKIEKKYKGNMKVEGGLTGLYMRIVVRRLGRGRGYEGFGNARALENILARIGERQAGRLEGERRAGKRPDDFVLLKEDLIGPEPSRAIENSAANKKLNALIGLSTVKDRVASLITQLSVNYHRELKEHEPVATSLNKVFSGSPGTGKTTVAKLYGQILADIGLLSNGEVIVKNPSDFIGSVLGESEQKTRGILASTKGKILLIDEAYMLYTANAGGNNTDQFRTAVIDTLVAEVQNVPGEDRCVLMAGYKDQMEEMFQNANPGLARRFDMENAFFFEDFTDLELRQVLELKLNQQDIQAADAAKVVAISVLSRERRRPNFGNGGAVDNILSRAKDRYMNRGDRTKDLAALMTLEPADFDPDFARSDAAEDNLQEIFADIVGCEDMKQKLTEYSKLAKLQRLREEDPCKLVPTTFVFKGPPGTGKTTVARKIGQVFYNMGFLGSSEVHDCSAKDLIGQYVGHTAPKVAKLFEKALGRVLFIDEAYRLGGDHFAKEAMDEIVDLVTKERFQGKIVVIIAGYEKDMNQLLAVNSGLSSRFPTEFIFPNMRPEDCLQVLFSELDKEHIEYPELKDYNGSPYLQMIQLLKDLSSLPSWGNARDVKTFAQQLIRKVLLKADDMNLVLSGEDTIAELQNMYEGKRNRAPTAGQDSLPSLMRMAPPRTNTAPQVTISTAPPKVEPPPPPTAEILEETHEDDPTPLDPTIPPRDDGVSDAIWNALQIAKAAEDAETAKAERDLQNLAESVRQATILAEKAERAALREAERLKHIEKSQAEEDERKRRIEQARLKALKARAEKEKIRLEWEKKQEEEQRKRKEEAKAQAKLQEMGICVAGFRWIKQGSGYQCAGGSHYISNAQLGI